MAPCVGGKEVQCAVVLMPASVCLSASLSAMLAWRIFSCDCQGVHGMRVEQTGETKVRTGGMTKEKQWPRMAKLSSPTAMLPTRDLMILFLKRSLYASWAQNFLYHPPYACPTSDAFRVAAINGGTCWPGQT